MTTTTTTTGADSVGKIKFAPPAQGGLTKTLKARVDEYFEENKISKNAILYKGFIEYICIKLKEIF